MRKKGKKYPAQNDCLLAQISTQSARKMKLQRYVFEILFQTPIINIFTSQKVNLEFH